MHLPVHWLLIALAALLLPACGKDDTAAASTATVHASEGDSATEGMWLRNGAPNSELRKSPEWTTLRQQASIDNDAIAVLGALEQAADLSPGSEEDLAAYGESSFYRLYWQVVRAKLTFDAAHRSGNPIKTKAASQEYVDRINAIDKEWSGRSIKTALTVYNITEQRLILGWSSIPLRFMPPMEVMIVAAPEETPPEQAGEVFAWPYNQMTEEPNMGEMFQWMGTSMAANYGAMMNPNMPLIQRTAHSASSLFAVEYSFIRGYYDGLMSNPASLALPGNTAWMTPPAKLIAVLESTRPSPVLAYCPIPSMFPLERAAELNVGDTLEGVFEVLSVKASDGTDEFHKQRAWLPVAAQAKLLSVSTHK